MMCRSDCPICGGDGFFRLDLPVGHPLFGKLLECPNVPVEHTRMFRRSGLREEELKLDPDDMLDVNEFENVKKTVEDVLRRGYGFVYLWGEYGTGKTTFLRSLVASWFRRKYAPAMDNHKKYFEMLNHPDVEDVRMVQVQYGGAAYLRTSQLIEVMTKAEFNPDRDNEARDIEFWMNCKLLVLDEFDKVRETPYAREKRFWFFDERYERALRKRAITIMVGNMDPEKDLDGYIFDRLRDKRSIILWSGDKSFRPVAEE